MVTCKDIQKLLKKEHDITDKASQSKEIQRHIKQCPACRKELEDLNKAWALLDALPEIKVSSGFESRFWARLRSKQKTPFYKEFLPQLALRFTYVMALWAVVIGVSFLLTNKRPILEQYNDPVQRFVQTKEYNSITAIYGRRLPKRHRNYFEGGTRL